MTAADVLRWMARAPAERASLPASGVLWTAAEILHASQVAPAEIGLASAAVTAITYAKAKGGKHAGPVAAGVGAAGAWLTLAADAGPLAWPWHGFSVLTGAWAAGSAIGYLALRRHEGVREAREWRKAKADWLEWLAPLWGLHGSHLLSYERTRLGEAWVADVTGTGRRASSLAASALAEDIAGREHLPVSRVRVTEAGIAGRIRISVRRIDPWKDAITHPVLDDDPEIGLPVPCTIREPLIVGQDPETGRPLRLEVWHKHGARNVLIVGMKEAGKTVLQNNVRERVTAAEDALLWDINVSKALEDAEWAPACDLAAVGQAERKRAFGILRCARRVIDYRGAQPRDTAVFQPSRDDPLIVINIDEIDALVSGGDQLAAAIKEELAYIASKGRSEGVALIIAGQRATADWIGGANLRSQIDLVCFGKVGRRGEMNHAGDIGLMLPDMASYGEGNAGVWCIAELGGAHEIGRTFNLESPLDLRRLAHERAESQPGLEPGLVAHLGKLYEQLRESQFAGRNGRQAPAPVRAERESAPSPQRAATVVLNATPLDALDGEMESMLPPDLRDRLRQMDARRAQTAEITRECDEITASLPDVDQEAMAASARARWAQAAAQTDLDDGTRRKLIMLLSGDGMSGRKINDHFPGTGRKVIMLWLNKLRAEGVIHSHGKGPALRWRLADHDGECDAR